MKKYILFDNDGVLVETEALYYEASKRALKEFFNYEISFDRYMDIMTEGKGVWVVVPNATNEQITKARDQRDLYYQEYIKSKNTSIAGVEDILEQLSKNYKMAIVTTSRRVDFELIHKNTNILKYMEFVLCVEDYEFSKPHPMPYLKGLEKFKSSKEETIVIEDSQRGLISAVKANIDCAIVYNEFTSSQNFSDAKYKIQSLKDLESLLKTIK